MELAFQVLSPADQGEVYDYALKCLEVEIPDATEREFASWDAKWRKEALEHYLKFGWSFIARNKETKQAVGFFLAQPFLFFRGQTQTVWVEHVQADTREVEIALVDIAVRVAREKHLQRVLFADAERLAPSLQTWNPEPLAKEPIAVVKTTKG